MAGASAAFDAVLTTCLDQVGRQVGALGEGDPAQRAEQVHQLRVGLRRLRTVLRAYRGWVAAPPASLVEGLRALFAALGRARDLDVLSGGIAAELAQAGAPPLPRPVALAAVDSVALARSAGTRRLLQAWAVWRTGLDPAWPAPPALRRLARRRLRRWQRRLARDCRAFDSLDAAALHALRKRIKRQRYALEGFAPLLPRQAAARHLRLLAAAQQQLGELHDLGVTRAHYQALVASDPAAWFAVGWLSARLAALRERARDDLVRLGAVAALPR